MIPREKLRFQKGDWLAVALVLALAVCTALCFLPQREKDDCRAEIYLHGELIKTVDLQTPKSFVVQGEYVNTIEVKNGAIGIAQSDCPGEDCVHTGFVSRANRSIVCLPNALEIRIVADQADVDFVVR